MRFKCFIPLINVNIINIIKFNYYQVFYIYSNVNAPYNIYIYAYIHKNEIKHYKNSLKI